MTLARNGLDIQVVPMGTTGKLWMTVQSTNGPAPVSFEDWFLMIRALGECEVAKYTARYGVSHPRDDWQRWTDLARRFFDACFDYDATYPNLRAKFGLPR